MSVIRKKGRRAFLIGTGGATLALPLLRYTQTNASAQCGGQAKRMLVFFSHGGTIMARSKGGSLYSASSSSHHGLDDWSPRSPGEELEVGAIMEPLEAAGLTPYLLLPRAVDNMSGQTARYGGGHKSSNVSALTAEGWTTETRTRSNGDEYDVYYATGPSIEQVVAQRLAEEAPTPFTSVNLRMSGHQYGSPLFSSAGTGVDVESSPRAAFDALFGSLTPPEPDPALVRRQRMRRSVLDGVLSSFGDIRRRVGREDQLTLDAHAEHVRSLERRVDGLEAITCMPPAELGDYPDEPAVIANLHADLIVHAFRCGLTNVATLQIADIVARWLPTPFSGGETGLGHTLHHAGRDVGDEGELASRRADWRAEMLANRQWRMQVFGRILSGLRDTLEGDGNMLDNTIALYTSEFSYGAIHSVTDQPILLAGRAGGCWRTGRHLNYNLSDEERGYETRTSTHNVYTSVLQAFGYEDEHFGSDDSDFRGPLDFS